MPRVWGWHDTPGWTFPAYRSTSFSGFVAEMPITRIEIDTLDNPIPLWSTMDNLIVSQ